LATLIAELTGVDRDWLVATERDKTCAPEITLPSPLSNFTERSA